MTRCVTSVLLIVGGWHGRVWAAMPERLSGACPPKAADMPPAVSRLWGTGLRPVG